MSDLGLMGLPRGKTQKRGLIRVRISNDLVNRDFTTTESNKFCVTDITEDLTKEGTVDACVALDATLRKAVGWAVDRTPAPSLVDSAFFMVYSSRRPAAGGTMHGDHGTQFAPGAFTSKVEKYGLGLSLGTIGDCYENAMIFWFWPRLQTELLDRKKWTTILELSTKIADNIDTLRKWRPSSLDMLTPTDYENPYAPMLRLT